MSTFDYREFKECMELEFEFYENYFDFQNKSLTKIFFEDDFSFFVKYSSLLELILSQAIYSQIQAPSLNTPDLAKFVRNLDINNHRTGKTILAYELEILIKEEVRFIQSFTEQRNRLVHGGNLLFYSIIDHVASFDKKELRTFINRFTCDRDAGDQTGFFGEPVEPELVQAYPKEFIMAGFMGLLCNIHTRCIHITLFKDQNLLIHSSFEKRNFKGVDGQDTELDSLWTDPD